MARLFGYFAITCVISIGLTACTAKKDESHETPPTSNEEWKPMDEFHMIMAESFHPFRDSADLGPARANAESLAKAAEKWQNSPIPEKVNNDGIKAKLEQLKAESAAFATISKSDDDNAIGDSLTRLHDLFHSIQEEWYGGHEEEQEHH